MSVKFDILPERQSKIDTMMKQEEHGLEEQLYCICRSSDISKFMIGCDRCEEWYHGDCIDIGEEESRYIKKFYCPPCQRRDPSLEIRYKQSKLDKVEAAKEKDKRKRIDEDRSKRVKEKERERERHREKEKQREREKQRDRERRREEERRQERERQKEKERQKERERQREKEKEARRFSKHEESISVLQEANYSDDDVWEPPEKQSRPPKVKKKEVMKEHRRKKRESVSEEEQGDDEVRQCYGPGCTKPSKFKSKYCSDNCGLNLATARIYQILPSRIQEWNSSQCTAEEKNRKSLEQIRKQQMTAKSALEELDRRHKGLDALISRLRTAIPIDDEDDEGESEGDASTTYCITCGIEIPIKTALRHMDKCFNKFESQTSFGSVYKTHIEGNNMFCDFFNPTTGMYCKRLRVLCPEHCKEPKISETEVCGCPLLKNVLEESNEFCRVAKKKCVRHLGWEKLRRAEIDMERVRQWLKIDDLFEKERQVRQAMASRAGVLSLLLHSTYNHALMDPQPEPEKVQQAVPHSDHDYF
ncbi:CXXC-type zinc finger protein 1-like isoform X2 [Artemia franciscana]